MDLTTAPGSLAPHLCTFRDTLYLSWVQPHPDSGFALWYSRLSGSGWEPGVSLVHGKNWFVNWADIPKLQVHALGLAAAWLEKAGDSKYAYGVRIKNFATDQAAQPDPTWLHSDTSSCEHGFVSLAPLPEGGLQAAWLDGRETLHEGPMSLRTAHITASGKTDGETVLDPRVCDCCPTATVHCPDGSIVVAYRDRSEEEVRDIAVTRQRGGVWSTPRVVHRDEWKIAGCPVNGPALAVSDSLLALAWFTMAGGVDPTVQVMFSDNAGQSFGAPVRVDRTRPEGRVDVAWLADGRALVAWLEASDTTSSLWVRTVSAEGLPDTAILITEMAPGRTSGIPSVAATSTDVVIVWTESGETTRVRTARLTF